MGYPEEQTEQRAIHFSPVILAGGSGTRFWPRSRRHRAKQILALDGERTMIQQTVDRLLPVASADTVWVITNDLLREEIIKQLPIVDQSHIVSEPTPRNTAPACALAAFLLERSNPATVIGIFPSDHAIRNEERFAEIVKAGVTLASTGPKVVVLGIPATRAETGYGYIELGEPLEATNGVEVRRVKRFTEKPHSALAEAFLAAGNYVWNSGMFFWGAKTLANAIREHSSQMATLFETIAAAYGTNEFSTVLRELYPQCENISIDYAVLEPQSAKGESASEIYCLPGDFSWNDLGCWSALHEHVANCGPEDLAKTNIFETTDRPCINIDSQGNYVFLPGKAVALVGVSDLVVVGTEDALLITTRDRSQDVGKVVTELKQQGREDLV
ncbi:MAG TPA: mannose-1-phosphate guanylyltransferase [Edaphobacter sp.]|nr:mannose-1-phosphate guanylyltransferase [Edaphobacter sp.]